MRVEIDQSGKVEDLNTTTVVGFWNEKKGSLVSISAGEKRKVVQALRKSPWVNQDLPSTFFATMVFILIRDFSVTVAEIDEEYTGKGDWIFEAINKLLVRFKKREVNMRFVKVGKRSEVHQLVWHAHHFRKKYKGRKVLANEVIGLILP